jgi:hypothetical protein
MAKIAVLGIDLGKNVCSPAGFDETGTVVLRRRIKRGGFLDFVRLAPCTIAMEACCGAHTSNSSAHDESLASCSTSSSDSDVDVACGSVSSV